MESYSDSVVMKLEVDIDPGTSADGERMRDPVNVRAFPADLVESQLALATRALEAVLDADQLAAVKDDIFRGVAELEDEIETALNDQTWPCDVCDKSYKSVVNLRRHVESRHSVTMNDLSDEFPNVSGPPRDCDVTGCDESFPNLEKLRRHKGRVHGVKPFKCDRCDATFAIGYDLNRHAINHTAERKHKCQYCGQGFRSTSNRSSHERRVHRKEKVRCPICQKEYAKRDGLKAHIRSIHTGEKPYQCSYCPMKFSHRFSFTTHELKHTGIRAYECDQCTLTFRTSGDMNKHRKSHSSARELKCPSCPLTYNHRTNMKQHVSLAHPELRPFACEVCDATFKDESYLVTHHKVLHLGEKGNSCEICGKYFKWPNSLRVHMKCHTDERRFKCHLCPKTYLENANLDKHLRLHQFELTGVFECDICHLTKRFTSRKNVLRHRALHYAIKRHFCTICERGFKQKCQLATHMRLHTGVKPYACNVGNCEARFATQTNLVVHQRSHTGEKPFQCSYCERTFSQNCNRRSHEKRAHTKERNFGCDECDKTFVNLYGLRRHRARKHGETRLPCPKCPRTFKLPAYLRSHLKKHTGTHHNTKIYKPITCEYCIRRFKSVPGLRTHMTRRHAVAVERNPVGADDTVATFGNPIGTVVSLDSTVTKLEPVSEDDEAGTENDATPGADSIKPEIENPPFPVLLLTSGEFRLSG